MLILVAMIIAVACSKDDDLNGYDEPIGNGNGNGSNGNNNDTVICLINPNDPIVNPPIIFDGVVDSDGSSDTSITIEDLSNLDINENDSVKIILKIDSVYGGWCIKSFPLSIYLGNNVIGVRGEEYVDIEYSSKNILKNGTKLRIKSYGNGVWCRSNVDRITMGIKYELNIILYKCEDI